MPQHTGKSTRPWRMLLPLFAVIIAGLIWSAYWWVAIGLAKTEFASQRARLAALGNELTCGAEHWGGYPFRFEFTCDVPGISLGSQAAVKSGMLRLVALAYKPWHVLALLDGPTLLSTPREGDIRIVHRQITASLRFGGADKVTLSAEIPQLQSDGRGSWNEMLFHLRTAPQGAFDVAATVKGLRIVTDAAEALLIDEGVLLGKLDSSFSLAVEKVDLRHQQVAYWGSGSVTLDASRRLQGKLSTETNDVSGLIGLLEPHLALNDQQRGNLRMLAGLLGKSAKIDLVAQDGAFLVGPLKVADLLPVY